MSKGRPVVKARGRYYYRYAYHDDLSRDEAWRIYDREHLSPQGEDTPILLCRSIRHAREACETLNDHWKLVCNALGKRN